MDFLRRLFSSEQRPRDDGLYLHVRCAHCSSVLRVRIDLRNELVPEYGDDTAEGYTLRKEMMDARCFRLMYATLTFDGARRETGRTIEGGEFITREEYERLTAK